MQKILISACLLGEPVRYNGAHKFVDHPIVARWMRDGRVVSVCPEVAGGLGVPRPPAEIEDARGGRPVLAGEARVFDSHGVDVTREFVGGASHAVLLAKLNDVRVAVLKEGSPSCGSSLTSDGTFAGRKVELPGVTTAALERIGVRVFSEHQIAEADAYLEQLV